MIGPYIWYLQISLLGELSNVHWSFETRAYVLRFSTVSILQIVETDGLGGKYDTAEVQQNCQHKTMGLVVHGICY